MSCRVVSSHWTFFGLSSSRDVTLEIGRLPVVEIDLSPWTELACI